MNYKYAKIVDGKVVEIIPSFQSIQSLADPNQLSLVEISKTNPQPQVGWGFDYDLCTFHPPQYHENPIVISEAKTKAKTDIDLASGNARLKFITNIPGQSEVYREKYDQAVDFLTSTTVVVYEEYPLLLIESQLKGIPMKNIAENIIKKRSEWISKITQIEMLRLGGKMKIDSCTTVGEINKTTATVVQKLFVIETNQ